MKFNSVKLCVVFLFVFLGLTILPSQKVFAQQNFFTVEEPIAGKYIVVLKEKDLGDDSEFTNEVDLLAGDLAASNNGTIQDIYKSALKGFSVSMFEEDAIALSDDQRVSYVIEDGLIYLSDTQVNPPYGLDRIDQRNLPLSGTYTYTSIGSGVTAFVIDSGLSPHSDFNSPSGNRASVGANFVNDGSNGYDCNGHGTHVAGTIGGNTYGVAKGVTIKAVKVFGCSNSGATSTVIAGVDWVRANRTSRSVANMSLGGSPSAPLDTAVRNLIASGVTTVIAAGNNNANANNYTPARVKEAIVVGATNSSDTRASFSNFGNAVDVFAPGEGVLSCWLFNSTQVLSGTSMATPHVAGAVALYLQPSGFPVIPTPAQIQNAIVANATWNVVGNRGTGSPNTLLFVGQYEFSDFLRPLFRYYDGQDHFYNTDWNEIGAGVGAYSIELIQGKVYSTQAFGTVPLHRYYRLSTGDHFYTIDFSALGNGSGGYAYEGITGYVSSSAQSGYVPLYRYWNSTISHHFYTTDFGELGNGGGNWAYEGIECYVIP